MYCEFFSQSFHSLNDIFDEFVYNSMKYTSFLSFMTVLTVFCLWETFAHSKVIKIFSLQKASLSCLSCWSLYPFHFNFCVWYYIGIIFFSMWLANWSDTTYWKEYWKDNLLPPPKNCSGVFLRVCLRLLFCFHYFNWLSMCLKHIVLFNMLCGKCWNLFI